MKFSMMSVVLVGVVLVSGCSSSGGKKIDPNARFDLICIQGPPATADTPENWQAIADAGYTLVTPGFPYDEAWQLTTLDRCEEYGMLAVPRTKVFEQRELPDDWRERVAREVAAYKGHPAMYGYYMVDEPPAKQFEIIGKVQRAFLAADPDSVPSINLFPTYASQEQLGTATYAEHLKQFTETVDPLFISYDNYPFLMGGGERGGNLDDFYLNLELTRDAAIAHGVPAWLAGQCEWHSNMREVNEAELRVQAYSALAYGYKAIGYFTYWPVQRPEPYASAVDYEGNRQPLYDRMKRVNLRTKRLGDMLVKMESVGVYHTGKKFPGGCVALPNDAPIWVEDSAPLVVGLFEDGKGRSYVMLANRDFKRPVRFNVSLREGRKGLWVVGGDHAEEAVEMPGGLGELSLPAGGGVLLRLGGR